MKFVYKIEQDTTKKERKKRYMYVFGNIKSRIGFIKEYEMNEKVAVSM